jgi:hypothetical protein
LATSPGILESGLQRAAHTDCTNAISMTANSKGGRFTNITTGTGGANTHIEPEPSALLIRAAMMVSREMGRFQPPHGVSCWPTPRRCGPLSLWRLSPRRCGPLPLWRLSPGGSRRRIGCVRRNFGLFVDPEAKEARSIPVRAGDGPRDGGEAGIGGLAPDKAICNDSNSVPLALVFAHKHGARLEAPGAICW